MPEWKNGAELKPNAKATVLNAYPYRMTVENEHRNPWAVAYMRTHGHKLPLITDAQWLASHYFAVRKDGDLDRRVSFCSSVSMD